MSNPRETYNRLSELLNEVTEALTAYGSPVGSQAIVTGSDLGSILWDQCCGDGHAFLRIVRIHPVDPFPNQTFDSRPCLLERAALVEVGIIRCHPVGVDDQGQEPKPEEITEFSQQAIIDMSIIHNTLRDYNPDWYNHPIVFDTWNPISNEGGCAGGAWQVWVDIAICTPNTSPTSI